MRINYKKYGMERAKDLDFADDGAYFRCYLAGKNKKVRVSVTTYEGDYFISARIDGTGLPYVEYEVRKTLPGYDKLDMLNGVAGTSITENDLKELENAINIYEEAYLNKIAELNLN